MGTIKKIGGTAVANILKFKQTAALKLYKINGVGFLTVTPASITFASSTRTCSFTTAGGGGSSCTGNGTITIANGSYNLKVYVSINTGATPLTINEIDATIGTVDLSASTTSQYVAGYSANVLFGPGTYNFSYLVLGSGGTNTGGGGGILYELVA